MGRGLPNSLERKSVGLNGNVADTDMGHAIEFPAQMSLYQHHSGFRSCVSVAKSGFVWQLPWQPDHNQPF